MEWITIYTLSGLEFLQGLLTLAFTLISFLLGLLLLQKYFKYKNKQILLVSISWILLISPWWPDSISFILITFSGGVINLNDAVYFFIANTLIAPIHYTWLQTFGNLVLKEKPHIRKIIIAVFSIWAIIFEIFFLFVFFIDFHQIGTRYSAFYVEWTDFVNIYLLLASILFTLTGLIFAGKASRSREKEIQLKGIFLIIAFITFAIGTIIDIVFVGQYDELTLVLARTFVIIAAFSFYVGFTLPRFIKKLIIKE